ncbi:MAG: hypothetical protein V3S38_08215 [Acidimicrobiia bacterium]
MKATSMAGNSDPKGPGNDGSWFLETVGAIPAAPTPSETVAALELENTLPEIAAVGARPDVVTTFDGSTGTSTSTYAPTQQSTQTQPKSAPHLDLPSSPPAPPNAEDTRLAPVLRTRRWFRWPTVVFGVFVIAAVAVAAVWVPAALRQEAVATRQAYAEASLSVREYLPISQGALAVITDPDSNSVELSSALPAISELGSHAYNLESAADAPLPRRLPLVSIESVEMLDSLRDTAQIHAFQTSDIARRLGYAYVYRSSIPQLLSMGDFPTVADVRTINTLSVDLASSLVEASMALSDLPDTESLANLNEVARGAVERYASWQDDYLTALSEGSETAAESLVSEMQELRSNLASELRDAMALVRFEIDHQIVGLATELDAFLAELTQW